MKILSGTSNLKLSKSIAKNLKLKLINTNIRRFADGEIYIEINENIRGNSVFVVQSTSHPANDNVMELLLVIDFYKVSIIPKTVTAETAATLRAKFLFLSIFFSSLILDNKSVNFTLLCCLISSE